MIPKEASALIGKTVFLFSAPDITSSMIANIFPCSLELPTIGSIFALIRKFIYLKQFQFSLWHNCQINSVKDINIHFYHKYILQIIAVHCGNICFLLDLCRQLLRPLEILILGKFLCHSQTVLLSKCITLLRNCAKVMDLERNRIFILLTRRWS